MGYIVEFFFLFLFVVITYIVFGPFRLPKFTSTRDEESWRRLAKSHKLNFTPGDDAADTFVSGSYGGHFLTLRTIQYTGQLYTLVSINRQLPPPKEVTETVLNSILALAAPPSLKGSIEAEAGGDRIVYRQREQETNLHYLRSLFKLLLDLMNIYPQLIQLGGEAIPTLRKVRQKSPALQSVCTQMIKDIAQDTSHQLGEIVSEVWCAYCLVQFKAIEVPLPDAPGIYYYGCRLCGQSRQVLRLKDGITALLDNNSPEEQQPWGEGLKVNWFLRQDLFDFDRIEIIRATDQEVERFAMQIGNDTDETRRARYRGMAYAVAPGCELSTNSLRVLEYTFREVE